MSLTPAPVKSLSHLSLENSMSFNLLIFDEGAPERGRLGEWPDLLRERIPDIQVNVRYFSWRSDGDDRWKPTPPSATSCLKCSNDVATFAGSPAHRPDLDAGYYHEGPDRQRRYRHQHQGHLQRPHLQSHNVVCAGICPGPSCLHQAAGRIRVAARLRDRKPA